jgi:cell division protein FtsB
MSSLTSFQELLREADAKLDALLEESKALEAQMASILEEAEALAKDARELMARSWS